MAYRIKYKGEFNHIIKNFDLSLRSDLQKPTLRYFFGFGNETTKDPLRQPAYYRTRYDLFATDALIRRRFLNDSIMSISAGPAVFYYQNNGRRNNSRILEYPSVVGLDSADVYTTKKYGGGKILFTINNLNDNLIPERGVNWSTEFTAMRGLNNGAQPFTSISSSVDFYATLSHPSKLVAALHLGGGHILSRHFEYFQAFTLGSNNYLRGYRINRFSGSSMAYGSVELRLKLCDFNIYLVKGNMGIIGFNDLGRVWMANERSQKWHAGYGGGIYITPFNLFMLTVLAGFSGEDRLVYGALGTKINFTFQAQ
jgi:outer membrane protein assembly factor BamA